MTRPHVRCDLLVAGAISVAVLTSACGTDADAPADLVPAAGVRITSAPDSGSEQPSDAGPLSPEEAEASAKATIQRFVEIQEWIGADRERDISALETVASHRALEWATDDIQAWRSEGIRVVGNSTISDLAVTATDLPAEPAADTHPSVEVTACRDVGGLDLVDRDGDSVVPAGRPRRVRVVYVVWDLGWPSRPDWRVVVANPQLTATDPPEPLPCR